MIEIIILVLILVLSIGAFLNSWIFRMRLELLENRIAKRMEQRIIQLYSMQYSLMRKQGWSHEELSEAFPIINDD